MSYPYTKELLAKLIKAMNICDEISLAKTHKEKESIVRLNAVSFDGIVSGSGMSWNHLLYRHDLNSFNSVFHKFRSHIESEILSASESVQ